MSQDVELGKIQFYWRTTDGYNLPKNVVPDFLPFCFAFDESTQLIRQKTNKVVLDALETIYLEEFNVGYLQEGHALAESYGNDVFKFVESAIKNHFTDANKILEIGCGGGYMLNKFKRELGLEIIGVDPSPVAVKTGEKFGYEVIKEFYPPTQTIDKVDIIFHYDVLEHIDKPYEFLKSHKTNLTDNGLIIFAVPDDTECIEAGDASMVIHEHINYFDKNSLKNVVEKSGFDVLDIQQSNHGGVLYCAARKIEGHNFVPLVGRQKYESFSTKYEVFRKNITSYIDTILEDENNSLGIYIALRVTPYITKYSNNKRIRFFDDDPGIHGKYYDGYDIPVENMEDLQQKPLTHIIVASHSFGELIGSKVAANITYPIEVKLLNEFA
tara:strand:- start:3538 stop:4686 length:1149 start_codon:yes stop_codon:yes gene_type:complete